MATFEQLFPTFIAKCVELHQLLRLVAFALFIVGTILFAARGVTGRRLMRYLVRMTVLTALLVYLPQWGNQVQALLQASILDGLGVDPSQVHAQYNALLVVQREAGPEYSWWNALGQLQEFAVEKLITAALWLLGQFASLLLFWAYIIQKFILFTGYALSPLLIGLMAIPPLRETGNRYLLNLVGVLLWPLGWAVAALITQGILDYMTDPSFQFFDPTATAYTLQATLGLAAVAVWITFSTVAAPLIIQKTFMAGSLAGADLLGGAAGNMLQSSRSATEAAVMVAPLGRPLVTGATAALAGALGAVSLAALPVNAGDIISAGRGLPRSRGRNQGMDDLTGDRAVRDLIARSKEPLL